jgi:hypothetical protein
VSERTGDGKCAHGRDGLAAELRALALLALDRLEPLLAGARAGSGRPEAGSTPCPVCAGLAVLRGEHPELAERLADRAAGLVAVLREALDESVDVTPPPRPAPPRVQRIPVERAPAGRDGARC